jgi:hypothetical protein
VEGVWLHGKGMRPAIVLAPYNATHIGNACIRHVGYHLNLLYHLDNRPSYGTCNIEVNFAYKIRVTESRSATVMLSGSE